MDQALKFEEVVSHCTLVAVVAINARLILYTANLNNSGL
jgi:hypothetical protein